MHQQLHGRANSSDGITMLQRESAELEKQAQQAFVDSDTLPAQMSPYDHQALKGVGVVFWPVVGGDELFTYVVLPRGWKKVATNDRTLTKLQDEKGRTRAWIYFRENLSYREAYLEAVDRLIVCTDHLGDGEIEKSVVDSHGDGVFAVRAKSHNPDCRSDEYWKCEYELAREVEGLMRNLHPA